MLRKAREVWLRAQLLYVLYRCQFFHKKHQIKLPLYRQGTYTVIGEALFCKKCVQQ